MKTTEYEIKTFDQANAYLNYKMGKCLELALLGLKADVFVFQMPPPRRGVARVVYLPRNAQDNEKMRAEFSICQFGATKRITKL